MDNKLPRNLPKPWLLSPKDITWQQWKSDPNAVCRAQHLKTIRWLKSQGMLMGSLKLSLDELFTQARKDVIDG